jgi:hypothetical protein
MIRNLRAAVIFGVLGRSSKTLAGPLGEQDGKIGLSFDEDLTPTTWPAGHGGDLGLP